jgi:predicted nucleic acid-binding Zn ribbon protein
VAAQPAVNEWPRLAGERIAQHARAVAVDRGVLVVVVDSPAWMTQLAFLKPELLRKVAARVGRGRVKDLRLVLGHGPTRDSA